MGDLINIATPVGELHWVNISGQGKLNYNEDGYNYVATVHLTGKDAEDTRAKIDAVLGEVPKGKNLKSTGYRELLREFKRTDDEKDPETYDYVVKDGKPVSNPEGELFTPTTGTKEKGRQGEPSGIWAFAFSTATKFGDGKDKKIKVYNAKAAPVELGDRKVGNGSKGAVSGKMARGEKGKDVYVSLYLNAVQITNYVPYEGDAGFGEAADGEFTGFSDEPGFESQQQAKTDGGKEATPSSAKPRL